jgi:hypothetical protein
MDAPARKLSMHLRTRLGARQALLWSLHRHGGGGGLDDLSRWLLSA